jgi:hypothetical protein
LLVVELMTVYLPLLLMVNTLLAYDTPDGAVVVARSITPAH